MRSSTLSLLCGVLVLAGCSGGGGGGGETIPRQKFVDANVALRSVPDTVPGTDSLRVAVLRKLRVTDRELRAFVQRNGTDTELMAAVWKEVADSLGKRDSVALALQGRTAPPPPRPAAEDESFFPTEEEIKRMGEGAFGEGETASIRLPQPPPPPRGGPPGVRPETASIVRPSETRPRPIPPRPRQPTPPTTQPPREMVRQIPPQRKAEIPVPPSPPPPAQP